MTRALSYIQGAALLAACGILLSQMPDWKYFRDREGNVYYIDGAGKIRITGSYEETFRPVSEKAIDYYLNQGIELVNRHRIVDGLRILKSIVSLKSENNRVNKAREKAVAEINRLMRTHGPRFDRMNSQACLLLHREGLERVVRDDIMRFSFRVLAEVPLIRKRERARPGYLYHGFMFGIRKDDTGGGDAVDALLAVDCERYAVPIRDMENLEDIWRQKFGRENMKRTVIKATESRVIYQFGILSEPFYEGYESLFLNGDIGCMTRAIAPKEKFPEVKDMMLRVTESFTPVEKWGGRIR